MKITSSSTEVIMNKIETNNKSEMSMLNNNVKSEMSMLNNNVKSEMSMFNNSNNNNVIDFQGVFSNTNSQFMPKCPLCEKTFANSSNLKHHMNTIHFNEAKWICNECGKVCTSKSNLKVHLRVHLRVKPYYCRWCDYNCMHHSSIRDHLSKCHPDKSHNSCEPGYIFNSTAVPEPELSHFEPNTSMHSFDLDKKLTNKILNTNSINNKRSLLNDSMKDEPSDINEFSSLHYSNEELANNIKKFKQDYEINKLKKSKKLVKNKFRGFKDKPQMMTQQLQQQPLLQQQFEPQSIDEFQQNNENYDQNNTYYSDDENNTSIDETLNENPTLHNKNSSPSASISSSITNDSHISSTSNPKNHLNNLHTLQFLTSNFSNIYNQNTNSSQNQQAEFFANLFSNLPNVSDYQTKGIQESGSVNNIASAILQRLSTVALFQQISNKQLPNEDLTSPETNRNSDNIETDPEQYEDGSPGLSQKQEQKPKSHCGLDLSLKAKKLKGSCDNDTSDEYYSALSPVSTSSTNLSTSSLSSLSKLKIKEEKSQRLEKSTESHGGNKKGILDVINRIKSQKSSPQSESSDIVKEEEKSACLDHDVANNGLDELNDLIKSHLLPISEAVFDKYKTFFDCKKSTENHQREDESDYDEHNENFHETPSSANDDSHTTKTDNLKKKCTFCNIFKNLLDLHELLHTT